MASSVSSERAFSSAGITVSKRRNRLKGDIVEALQFLKCLVRKDLLYREPAPSSLLEVQLELNEGEEEDKDSANTDANSWDKHVIDIDDDTDDDDNSDSDTDM